jgi:hypothetical protein
MLLLAFSCRFNVQNLLNEHINNNNYFFDQKEKKRKRKKRKKKKDMQVKKQCSGGCQGFLEKKYYLQGGDFFQKPGGLDLYCR